MQDRFQPDFDQRIRQSQTARIANLEVFRAHINPVDGEVGLEPVIDPKARLDSSKKHVLTKIPRKLRYPVLAATAGAALLGAACGANKTGTEQAPVYEGQVLGVNVTPVPSALAESTQPAKKEFKQAWDFTLKDKNGIPMSLHDLGNRPVIIEYSQPGCPPCRRESNKLSDIMKKYASQGLVVLNVSIGTDDNFNPSVPLLLDPKMEFASEYGIVSGVPATIFIREGKVVYTYFDSSEGYTDLDKLSEAFMAGKDLDGILPTVTPGPTETSTPVITKEKLSSNEAVFDLGNFDLGIKEWEEWPNAHPTQLEIGGKMVDVKNVVVKTIFRSKADRVSNLIDSADELLNSNVSFVDSSGQDIAYYPGSGRVSVKIDEPLKYGGAVNEPFVQNLKGDFIDTDLLCSSKKYTLDRFTAGFGIPVSIIATVPINVRDYGIAILEPGASKRKIVMKNEAATDFKTISEDVPIHDPDYVFRLQGSNGEYVDSSFKGLQSAQYSPGFPPDMLARFHFIDRFQGNPFYYSLLQGNLFLEDGRVLQMDFAEGSLSFGQEGDLQGNVGGINPENRCPLINANTLRNANGFDLKGSIAVINFGFESVAWRVQDGE